MEQVKQPHPVHFEECLCFLVYILGQPDRFCAHDRAKADGFVQDQRLRVERNVAVQRRLQAGRIDLFKVLFELAGVAIHQSFAQIGFGREVIVNACAFDADIACQVAKTHRRETRTADTLFSGIKDFVFHCLRHLGLLSIMW